MPPTGPCSSGCASKAPRDRRKVTKPMERTADGAGNGDYTNMRNVFSPLVAAAVTVGIAAAVASQPVHASFKNKGTQAQEQRKQATAEIPLGRNQKL